MEQRKMLVGGDWVEAKSGEYYDNTNPANGELISRVPYGGAEDVDAAVAAAQEAYDESWGPMDAAERGALMHRLADAVEANNDYLARLETADMGKPFNQSCTGDVPGTAAFFRYFAGLADKIEGETLVTPGKSLGYTLREPIGVVAAIVPWNFPLCIAAIKGGPALAAGNCVIYKPASASPTTALELGRLALEVGFPPGVIQVLTGPGGSMGSYMAGHPGVGKVTFTGSTEVGRRVLQASVNNIAKSPGANS